MKTVMEYKGFKAGVMEAPRLTGDQVHGLPPGTPLAAYPVDAFIKPPEGWMTGPGVFVVPVQANKGLWFDWRGNSELNTAVIPTVKGCNPITGLQTSGFHLEKYESKCPKHGCDFLAERFCPECDYKWPDRNYQSMSPSWWDGFRADDGTVRQFFFTEDELRDIATGLIGKENTVPAFGFAFYSPKERRAEPTYRSCVITTSNSWGAFNDIKLTNCTGVYGSTAGYGGVHPGVLGKKRKQATKGSFTLTSPIMMEESSQVFCCSTMDSAIHSDIAAPKGHAGDSMADVISLMEVNCERSMPVKEVSIGAGAKISQRLNTDSYALDTWKDTPDAVMTVYFVFQEMFNDIKAGGMRDLDGVKNGMLEGLQVG